MSDSDGMTELERKFPHIVENLTLLWNDEGISAFLSHLLIDDRGDRHGFTGDIMADLMFLDNLHEDMVSENQQQSGQALWENPLAKNLKS